MTSLSNLDKPFKYRHFDCQIIILCVRWYGLASVLKHFGATSLAATSDKRHGCRKGTVA